MERITERGYNFETTKMSDGLHDCMGTALNKLTAYEDAEEQGRLVRLPCKVGDTVYSNISYSGDYERAKDKPYPHRIVFIGINGSKDFFHTVNIRTERMFSFNFEEIDKTVFLTRQEAEKALEGIK